MSTRPARLLRPASLFWKLLFGFWATLLLAGLLVGTAVWLYHAQRVAPPDPLLAAGPRAELQVRAAAATLQHGGVEALRSLLRAEDAERGEGSRVHALDGNNHELLGRPVPPEAIARAQARLDARPERTRGVRRVTTADGQTWLLLVPAAEGLAPSRGSENRGGPARRAQPPAPGLGIAIGLLASLLFSAGLAAYLTRPIRHLRRAFADVADGRLDTRVASMMGRRRDEIAGLGADFDRMAERLQALIASQRRLLHDVSHELRSPLARLQAAIGLARQDPSRAADMLDRIERDTQRLDALVGELLTLARLEANAGDARRQSIDVADLVREIADDARFEAQTLGRSLVLSMPATPTIVDNAQPDWLQRAIENVIRNAIRHTAPGSAVALGMTTTADLITITVSDRGPGLAPEYLEAIFEPFQRGPRPDGDGYGLGLAIARRAMAAHGGRIVAANRPGGGLVMTLTLPRA